MFVLRGHVGVAERWLAHAPWWMRARNWLVLRFMAGADLAASFDRRFVWRFDPGRASRYASCAARSVQHTPLHRQVRPALFRAWLLRCQVPAGVTIPRLAARAFKLRPTGHRSAYHEVLRCGAPAGRLGVSRLTVTAMHHDHDASADQFHGSSNTLSVSSSLPHWAPGPSESGLLALGRFSLESSLMVRNEPEFPDPTLEADPACHLMLVRTRVPLWHWQAPRRLRVAQLAAHGSAGHL